MLDTYTVEELKVSHLQDRMYCIFDLEGTGINPAEESVTQFGAMNYKKGKSLDSSFTSLVRSSKPIPETVAKLTGISNEDKIQAPSFDADKLLADLNGGRILSQQTFEGLDVEAYLNQRDASEFADEWMQAFERFAQKTDVVEGEVLRACRERAFKRTIALVGDPELAGYISDDIGLIGAALLQDEMQDSFVMQLLERYQQSTLPLC